VPYDKTLKPAARIAALGGISSAGSFQSIDRCSTPQSYTITTTTRYPDGSAAYLVENQPARLPIAVRPWALV